MKQQIKNRSVKPHILKRGWLVIMAAVLLIAAGIIPLAAEISAKPKSDKLPGLGLQPVEYFYTGKPYDADTETYTFKYRSYDPELNRWTSADPSGFADGANNQAYAPTPLFQLDIYGLHEITVSRTTTTYRYYTPDWSQSVVTMKDFLDGITNFAGHQAHQVLQAIIDQVQKESPNYTADPESNLNFNYVGEDTIVGDWNPFDPAGFQVIEVHPIVTFRQVNFNYSYDPENDIIPLATIITSVTESMTVE